MNVGFSQLVIEMNQPFRPEPTENQRGPLIPLSRKTRIFFLNEHVKWAQTLFLFYL